MMVGAAALLAVSVLIVATAALAVRARVSHGTRRASATGVRVLGVLHPYANDGGGGERVLWVALRELSARRLLLGWRVVVYTGDSATPDEIRAHALKRFGIVVPPDVEFVYLRTRAAVEARTYPVATLLGQAVGSVVLLAEAVVRLPPNVLLDTTGYGFAYAAAKLMGVPKLGCYVHYPTITTEMSGRVASRAEAHNNAGVVARSAALTALKLAYYEALIRAYSASGAYADVVVANGSWTAMHLRAMWGRGSRDGGGGGGGRAGGGDGGGDGGGGGSGKGVAVSGGGGSGYGSGDVGGDVSGDGGVAIAFPPCDTTALRALPLSPRTSSPLLVLSIAQFRPEKVAPRPALAAGPNQSTQAAGHMVSE